MQSFNKAFVFIFNLVQSFSSGHLFNEILFSQFSHRFSAILSQSQMLLTLTFTRKSYNEHSIAIKSEIKCLR